MGKLSILEAIQRIDRPVFKTREISIASGISLSTATQALTALEVKGVILKASRGLWCLQIGNAKPSAYSLVPFLVPGRAYVSFISALHLHGVIEQIPQSITLASTGHTKTIRTKLGIFFIHRITPSFFKGFGWYKGDGSFLVAEPEKALVDCLYLSVHKKNQFGYFPELHLSKAFSFKKAKEWAKSISNPKTRLAVLRKLNQVLPVKGAA
jgi:predicted transcriptional regulator of viral defense system